MKEGYQHRDDGLCGMFWFCFGSGLYPNVLRVTVVLDVEPWATARRPQLLH